MAQLDSETKDALAAKLLSALSSRWDKIPITHQQVRAGIDVFDEQLEACETAILDALSSSTQAWLVVHQAIAREIVVAVEQARKEKL